MKNFSFLTLILCSSVIYTLQPVSEGQNQQDFKESLTSVQNIYNCLQTEYYFFIEEITPPTITARYAKEWDNIKVDMAKILTKQKLNMSLAPQEVKNSEGFLEAAKKNPGYAQISQHYSFLIQRCFDQNR